MTARPGAGISEVVLLVEAARQGDRVAFGQLYDRYARMVHGILLSKVPPGEVDDLVQDVFLLAMRRLNALRDAAAFGGWLAMITRNRANDYYRRTRETEKLPEDVEDLAGVGAPDDEAVAILAVVRRLPDAYRERLILRLVEGMTGPEIATRTGMTAGSVRVNLHRGMQMLRAQLAEANAKESSKER